MSPATDRELLERLHRGDAAAAEAFWARHAARVRAFARALTRSEADADDALQRVFCGLLSLEQARVRAIRDVTAFLMRSARHEVLNRLRAEHRERARRERQEPGRVASAGRSTADPALAAALERLPRRQREIVVLRSVLGLTFDQAALALGVQRTTAASRHAAGLAALERMLTRGEPTPVEAQARAGGCGDEP